MIFKDEFKELRNKVGLSQVKLSQLLDIPSRTIEKWETGERVPPTYVQNLLIEKLNSLINNCA